MKAIIILLLTPILLLAQGTVIKGKVITKGKTFVMKGAAITLLGDKTFHTATNENAAYEIKNVPKGKYIIKCEYVGFKTKTEEIVVTKNKPTIIMNFYLEEEPIHNENGEQRPNIKLLSKKPNK